MKKSKPGNSMAGMAGPVAYQEPKRVTVEKAKNGLVVSSHNGNGCTTMIAKNPEEAMKHMKKLLK